jgi:hypothetical protein
MANTVHISAGLSVSKTASVDPTANVNTVFLSAGLSPAVYDDEAGGATPWIYAHRNSARILGVNQ